MRTFSIRIASAGDGAGILRCLSEAFAPYRGSYTPEAFLDTVLTPETLRNRLANMSVFVAVNQQGDVIGTVAGSVVDGEEGHVRGMAVLPEWHGRGVASDLLAAVERELHLKQCCRISLDTTAPLEQAIRFYERHGFQRSGKVSDFFGMQLIEYVKSLA